MGFDQSHSLVTAPIIAPNKVRDNIREYTVAGSIRGFAVGEDYAPITEADEDIFLWVILAYRGPFTEGHETSACLRWNVGSARFVKHSTNSYEK
jgi:hypothetical protein